MLYGWIVWAWIKSLWQVTLFPLLAKIPWQVWGGLVVVVGFFYYGHIREQRALKECYAQVELAKNAELDRQKQVAERAVAGARQAEAEALQEANTLKGRLDDALGDVAKLKEANKVCLPRSVTDKFRGVRSPRR